MMIVSIAEFPPSNIREEVYDVSLLLDQSFVLLLLMYVPSLLRLVDQSSAEKSRCKPQLLHLQSDANSCRSIMYGYAILRLSSYCLLASMCYLCM